MTEATATAQNRPAGGPKPMRLAMPLTAAWIDDLRAAFGAEAIDGQIRNGIAGFPDFWASENGIEIGTKAPEGKGVTGRDMVLGSNDDLLRKGAA